MGSTSTMSIGPLRTRFFDSVSGTWTGWPVNMLLIEPDYTDRVKRVPAALAHRPYDLARVAYGLSDLFWVIPMVNGISDPIVGLTAGLVVLVPLKERVVNVLRSRGVVVN